MKFVNNFDQFISENTEFNFQRMNSDRGGMMPNVDDPQLSTNAFDKSQSAMMVANSRLNNILGSLSNTPQFAALKSKLSMQDQDIKYMKVIRIIKEDNNYNAYISFVIKDMEYWGVIMDVIGNNTTFKSEVFKDIDLIMTKEWVIKIKGLIIKIFKRWLCPDDGEYTLLKDEIYMTDVNTGQQYFLKKGSKVKFIRSFENKIIVHFKNDYYQLSGDSFIYFNWWFNNC